MPAIISASRRTDIPAFYFDWFASRVRAGFCDVANPFNPKQVRRVSLRPADVDAIVFWTKDPAPMVERLAELGELASRCLFLFTLNAYTRDLEPGLPPLDERVASFRELADSLGPERVVWRYDPIIPSNRTPCEWHAETFADLARKLRGATKRVILSFLDLYRKTTRRLKPLEERGWRFDAGREDTPEARALIRSIAASASENGIAARMCAEPVDYTDEGAPPGPCIDGALIRRLFGVTGHDAEDPGQRGHCRCAKSVDVGAVDTCLHGCVYCYSTQSDAAARRRRAAHDPTDSMLWRPGT